MLKRTFVVTYVTSKDSFLHFPEQSSKPMSEGQAMKVSYGEDSNVYFSCGTPLSWIKEGSVGISSVYAKSLGIKDSQAVTISRHYKAMGNLKCITISPTNNPDYEILEMCGDKIQTTLLNQVRIVNVQQKMIIWISKSLHVVVSVDDASPVAPGRLDNLTQVIISQPNNSITRNNSFASNNSINSHNSRIQHSKSCHEIVTKKSTVNPKLKESLTNSIKSLVFRVHLLETKNHFAGQPFNVFAAKRDLNANFLRGKKLLLNVCLYILRLIQPPFLSSSESETNKNPNNHLFVRLCILEDYEIEMEKIAFPVLYVSATVLKHFNVKNGAKVVLENLIAGQPSAQNVELLVNRADLTLKPLDLFKLYISQYSKTNKVVVNSDCPIRFNDKLFCTFKFTFPVVDYALMGGDDMRNCNFVVKEFDEVDFRNYFKNDSADNSDDSAQSSDSKFCLKLGYFEETLNKCIGSIKKTCSNRNDCNRANSNILITGKSGTGKSTILSIINEKLSTQPEYVHIEQINCKNIKGKNSDSLHKLLTQTFTNLIYYQPSALLLDNLDIICEKVIDAGDTLTQESLYFNRVSELIAEMIVTHVTRNTMITIVATAESALKLNDSIFATRGKHLFRSIFNIDEFSKKDRKTLLEYLFAQKATTNDIDFDLLALKTDGYVIQDIVDCVDKCIFEALKQESSNKSVLVSLNNCQTALENCVPLSMRQVKLNTTSEKDFSDVGGLDDVKHVLVESMQWPAKYPGLFNGAPLRPQSGLLLYGPPGTGKTLIAGATAKVCGMHLIAIKGPELLSKYIGASEQAVRNVFERAQSARPCILFFDEFDSLAPRRGHDSTGVTDRVVNQFLTQLDGIETLQGVCVVAATSRPDLLDPALLRPGRLDRQIFCPLPDETARYEILKALSKDLVFAEDIDLQKIAKGSKGFSGADLQAVLFTAQMAAVEILLKSDQEITIDTEPEINQLLLNYALKNTRPSLTDQENLRYEKIYSKFTGAKDETNNVIEQRATLA